MNHKMITAKEFQEQLGWQNISESSKMRYVKSNTNHTEWYVIFSNKGREFVVSKHSTLVEAQNACWPKY